MSGDQPVTRSLLVSVLWLALVLGGLLAAGLWWRDQLDPGLRVDRALRLEPLARPSVVGMVLTPVPLKGGMRLAWRLPAGRPGLRYQTTIPGDGALLRFYEATIQGLPDVAVRVTHADGSAEQVAVVSATEGAWTERRIPLPVAPGEAVELEIVALDGVGRPGLGEALVADVTLLSGGRAADEARVALPVESVAADLLAGSTLEQRRMPPTPVSARIGAPGPLALVLQPVVGRELRLGHVPPDARLALVLHAARSSEGSLEPTHVTVRVNDEPRARVRVDEAADPPGSAPAYHQLLVELDLDEQAGGPLSLRLELTGGANLVVGVVECVLLQSGTNPPREHDPEHGVNLLLLAVEGLRPDRLSAWGYGRGYTPNLDALALRGVVYERVLAPSGWSLPNLATLFTGLSPLAHGVGLADGRVLDPRLTTLAGSAGWAGLTSALFSSSPLALERTGLTRGYGRYERRSLAAPILVEHALDWLEDAAQFDWFLTLLLGDPSYPHEPELPELQQLAAGLDPDLLERLRALDSRPGAAEGVAQEVGSFYDAELARVDRALGLLLADLERRDLLEGTVIAVVGLHGQEFYERGGRSQGHSLHDEIVHVPLIVAGPGVVRPEDAPVVVRQPVSLADVTHLLGHVGRILSTGSVSDRVPPPFGPDRPHSAHHGLLAPVSGVTGVALESTRKDEWFLLRDALTGARQLFDLQQDPQARTDLARAQPQPARIADQIQGLGEAFASWYAHVLSDLPSQPRRWSDP
ncbi:MAG: hypothetical protein DRQ55_03860 [Planctomycetota bacterium]|nr:MAG: hypothetical protein DRQ55_03860 [Planctomycetota bacterium]